MTDEEKLEMTQRSEDEAWKAWQTCIAEDDYADDKFFIAQLDMIERCQRIRANLKPHIVFPDIDNPCIAL